MKQATSLLYWSDSGGVIEVVIDYGFGEFRTPLSLPMLLQEACD